MTFRPKCVKLNIVATHFICALKGKENMNMWNMNSFKIWSSFMKSGGWYVMPGTVLMSKFMQISSSSIFLKADIRLQTIYRSLKRWRNTHWHCSDIYLCHFMLISFAVHMHDIQTQWIEVETEGERKRRRKRQHMRYKHRHKFHSSQEWVNWVRPIKL